jgi:HK97 family phage major capsid protein
MTSRSPAFDELDRAVQITRESRQAGRSELLASEVRRVEAIVMDALNAHKKWSDGQGYKWKQDEELTRLSGYLEARLADVKAEFAEPMKPEDRKMKFGSPKYGTDGAELGAAAADQHMPMVMLSDGRRVRGALAGHSFAKLAAPGTAEEFSVGRAILASVTGDRELARAELSAQQISSDPSGGFFLAPEISGQFIDLARSMSVLVNAGAITLPLSTTETRVVKVTQDPAAGWHQELEALTSTQVQLGAVTLRSRTIGAVIDLSQELVEDAPNAYTAVTQTLAAAVAKQLDRALFRGIDDDNPFTGVLDDPNVSVTDMGTDGAAPTDYDEIVDAIEDCWTANSEPDVRIEHPRTSAQYAKLKEATTNAPLVPPPVLAQLRTLRSTQVPVDQTHGSANNASSMVVGNFGVNGAWVILGMRSNFRIETSREAGDAFENLGVKVRIWGRFDLAIGRPTHLARVEGLIPAS